MPKELSWLSEQEQKQLSHLLPFMLMQRGPVVNVTVMSIDRGKVFDGMALIDTGANHTYIELQVAAILALKTKGKQVELNRGSQEARTKNAIFTTASSQLNEQCTLEWTFAGRALVKTGTNPSVESAIIVIGRDLLQHGKLVYDGRNGQFAMRLILPNP